MDPVFAPVPRLWKASTMICVATGPSLCAADLDTCQASGHPILAINSAYAVCPSAEILYAGDGQWWRWHRAVPDVRLPAWKFSIDPAAREYRSDVRLLNYTSGDGVDLRPWSIRSGGHSGYAAINLAVHCGARSIVLLGYDLLPAAADAQQHHSVLVGEHPDRSHPHYAVRTTIYNTLWRTLHDLGISIVNASRVTAIPTIPRVTLDEALA